MTEYDPRWKCSVCGRKVTEYALVGKDERLCLGGDGTSCYSWFGGYPWVLFEMGLLKTENLKYRLWD